MASNEIPVDWQDSDQLDGADLYNKTELVGVLFRIRKVQFHTNAAGVQFAIFTVEKKNGDVVQFQDSSSTGCLMQIKEYLVSRGQGAAVDAEEAVPLALVCPRGLRASDYTRPDPNRPNRTISATTHYLTAAGTVELPDLPVKMAPAKKAAQPVKAAAPAK